MPRTIRIFISSPGDVKDERDRARKVVESLRRRYAGQLELQPLLWEDLPLQPVKSFQEGIDTVLSERGVDIAVFILWSRLGSPTGPLVVKDDGTPYRSGTEREYDLMMRARQQSEEREGKARPDILVYTRRDQASFDERLRGRTTGEQEDLIDQKKLVESFISEEFQDAETGTNIGAYHSFDQPVTFQQRLRRHLEELLDPLAGVEGGEPVWDIGTEGLPFLGLEAYQFHHAPVFFGREDEIVTVGHALRKRAEDGCAFVLISGSSGSGKSSLARAGVLPAVVREEVDSRVENWIHLDLTPGELGGDLVGGLAGKLAGALPTLNADPTTFADFAEQLRLKPDFAWRQFLRPALPEKHRLIVLVDQMEELFTGTDIDPSGREAFADVLEMLARSGAVWVVATMRSDFSHHCQQVPALFRLTQGGVIGLLPPTSDAIARVITDPARLAGLYYEEKDGTRLSDVLLREATERRELLPFLSHVLRRLAEEREEDGKLTFAAFETKVCRPPDQAGAHPETAQSANSLERALAVYADEVFSRLPSDAQATLPEIWPKLVTLGGDDGAQALRQYPKMPELTDTPAAKTLVDAFVEARLFTASGAGKGGGEESEGAEPTVTVVHETLLRSWKKASDWIAVNRRHLQMRSNVRGYQARWESSHDQADHRDISLLLPKGLPLQEGSTLLKEGPHLLAGAEGEATEEYIRRSQRHHERRARRAGRIRGAVVVSLALLLLLSLAGGFLALRQRDDARYNEGQGWLLRAEVADRPDSRLYPHNLFYAARAIGFEGWGRQEGAFSWRNLLAELVPSQTPSENFVRLIEPRQEEFADATSWIEDRPAYLPFWTDPGVGSGLTCLSFSLDGRFLLAGCEDGRVLRWDLRDDSRKELRAASDTAVSGLALHPDAETMAVGVGSSAEIWKIESGEKSADVESDSPVSAIAYGPDGTRLATGSADGAIQLWKDGKKDFTLSGHEGAVLCLVFHSDRVTLASGGEDGRARLWYLPGKKEGTILESQDEQEGKSPDPVHAVALSPDGSLLATGRADGIVRLWDAASGALLSARVRHVQAVRSLAFSPDGARLFSGSEDGDLMIRELTRPTATALVATLRGAAGGISGLSLGPEGKMLASASSEGKAVLWRIDGTLGSEAASDLRRYLGEDWYAFQKDGTALWTASQSGSLNLPENGLVSLLRRDLPEAERERLLFERMVAAGNWTGAGVLLARLPKDQDQTELAQRLLEEAEVAMDDDRFRVARVRLDQARGLNSAAGERMEALGRKLAERSRREEGHDFENGEGLKMIWIKPGTFLMGSPEDEEGRSFQGTTDLEVQHSQTLTQGFWMARTEVTQQQWVGVMKENPSRFQDAEDWEQRPVEQVSWNDAMTFCRQLTARETAKGGLPEGYEYSLPSEAQWEYACRAGTTGMYNVQGASLDDLAWYTENSDSQTHPVGLKKPNAWGLFDMHGNVWEWTCDTFWTYLRDAPDDYVETREGAPGEPGRRLEQRGGVLPLCEPQRQYAGDPVQRPGLPPCRGPLQMTVSPGGMAGAADTVADEVAKVADAPEMPEGRRFSGKVDFRGRKREGKRCPMPISRFRPREESRRNGSTPFSRAIGC